MMSGQRVYRCAVCGRKLTAAQQPVYSRFTGNRYCPPSIGHLKRRPKEAK